jgi:hypothetical protein
LLRSKRKPVHISQDTTRAFPAARQTGEIAASGGEWFFCALAQVFIRSYIDIFGLY